VHVERFESALWQTTSLLLVADGEAVAVDPCISRSEVSRIRDRSDELGVAVTHVLVTHADWDHVCGIAAFPGAVAAMGEATARIVESGAPAQELTEQAAAYGVDVYQPPRVDRALAPSGAHQIGAFVVETLPLRGHTVDGTGYRVRALDLLAVGDHLSPVEFPFASSSTADYRTTLAGLVDLLEDDPPAQVYPGHGRPLTAGEALEIARQDLAYLRELHDAMSAALAGGTTESARDAGRAVRPPRGAPSDLAGELAGNVEAQLAELLA